MSDDDGNGDAVAAASDEHVSIELTDVVAQPKDGEPEGEVAEQKVVEAGEQEEQDEQEEEESTKQHKQGHSHSHGHGHSHGGHGHSHGGGDKKKHECEWNYINIIIAAFCSLIIALLLGLMIFYLVLNTGPVRTYYIGIEEVQWSYAPGGNMCPNGNNNSYDAFNGPDGATDRIGSTYRKARYVQYTDETFRNKTAVADEFAHLGLLGPVLRASVGETLRVVVRNDASFPFSVNPWGLRIGKASEGSGYDDGSFFFEKFEDSVAPLALNQYTCTGFGIDLQRGCRPFLVHPGQFIMQDWPVTAEAGPQEGDGGSVLWLYTSDVDGQIEPGINAGLVGAIIIDAAAADTDTAATPDLEFVNVFLNSDENESPYIDMNMWDYLVTENYGEVVAGWVPFGFLDQAEVLRGLYARAAQANPQAAEQLDYDTAAALVNASIDSGTPVAAAQGVPIGVQFTDPAANPLASNSFDPRTFNGRNGDGAAQQVVHALFTQALAELKNDDAFQRSNRVQTINGLAFCNQPGLNVDADAACADPAACTVRWHTAAVGGEDSVHAPTWEDGFASAGSDAQVIPGATSVVDMDVQDMQEGTWTFGDAIVGNAAAGAQSTYTVTNDGSSTFAALAAGAGTAPTSYFIKAIEVPWDYLPSADFGAPAGTSACAADLGSPATAQFVGSKFSVGSSYTKWRFAECSDPSCTTTVAPDASVGITGPTLRVEAGRVLRVTLFNDVSENITLAATGLTGDATQASVSAAPGGSATFEWFVPAAATAAADNSRAWVYHSASEAHIHAGLLGAVVVVSEGQLDSSTGLPQNVDAEYALFVGSFDENQSPLAAQNAVDGLVDLRAALNVSGGLSEPDFATAVARVTSTNADYSGGNLMAGVNGRALCTLAGVTATAGETVRFHLIAPPTGDTVHSGRVGGHVITVGGHRMQTAALFPGAPVTFTVTASAGGWEVSDGAAEFFDAGVRAAFTVGGDVQSPATHTRTTRTFYIAADEVEWDYTPHGYNKCQHTAFVSHHSDDGHDDDGDDDDNNDAAKYVVQGPHRIGSKYVKAQYRRYSSSSFDVLQSGTISRANSASLHLGLLGTIITAEVGDTVVVHFKNNLRYPSNFVLPGPFQSAVVAQSGDALLSSSAALAPVTPGDVKVYTWVITEDMGPAEEDANSIVWSYGAHVFDHANGITPQTMAHAGLVGALVVVADGELKSSQTMPKGVNVEFVVLTGTIDENLSPYIRLNAQRYADDAYSIDYADSEFQESNRMRSINGHMFCNGEGWVATLFTPVRFYLLGTDTGIHSVNLHAHSIVDRSTNRNSFGGSVFAGGSMTGDTQLSSPGDWLLESSIATETQLGAQEMFTVHPLVVQFFKQTAPGFEQRNSRDPANAVNSVRGS